MTPERWLKVKEIFQSTLERKPAERSAFLSRACGGDDALRKEVESLLTSHEKDGSFIDSPAYEAAAELLVVENSELRAGQTIGHYEVLSMLGKGGMGEVYLANDTKLGRKVALKFLPNAFTQDQERLRRFEQEARAVSALNHPNIITIYEIRETDSTLMIATEFIEGETLRERMARNRLSLTESLHIAIQTADALTAAHKAGITHRDIKPDNIMLRTDALVKVLDFGLAKLAGSSASASQLEALTKKANTAAGMIMGTVGYMSPEQARGSAVDARSDIFSLGTVIYEMVAGIKPFAGDTPSDVLAAVLKTEPPPVTRVAPEVPAELERIIKKSLRKDREERYQGVKDLLVDLKSVKEELSFQAKLSQSVVPNNAADAGPTASDSLVADSDRGAARTSEIKAAVSTISQTLGGELRRHKTGAVLSVAALFIATTVAGIGIYRLLNRSQPLLPFQSMKITRLTNHGKAIHTAISPDGKYFVYVLSEKIGRAAGQLVSGNQSLWLRQISAANDTQIVPPALVSYFGVTFSTDGTNLYYVIKTKDPNALSPGVLYRVPVLGGAPVKLLDRIDCPISFSPDGKQFTFVRRDFPNPGESGLFIANADGSGDRQIAARKAPEVFAEGFAGPSWSKDGHLIACPVTNLGGGSQLIAVNLENGSLQVLTRERWDFIGRVEWLPDMTGLVMVASSDAPGKTQIFFFPYPSGQARKITNDLDSYRGLSPSADFKELATIQESSPAKIWKSSEVNFSQPSELPTGNVEFVGWGNDSIASAPEGRIVYVAYTDGNPHIWIMDSSGGNRRQLTHESVNTMPAVSPDGRYIVFISPRAGARNVWRMDLDGNNPKRLTSGAAEFKPTFSADGHWVLYTSLTDGKLSLWKVPIDGGTPVLLVDKQVHAPAVSPDGKFIAYLYAEHFLDEPPRKLAIIPFDGGEPINTFDVAGGNIVSTVRWASDGQSLFFSIATKGAMNIWEQRLAGGPPKQLTNFAEDYLAGFALSRDGKQFVCERGTSVRDAVLITNTGKQ
jgi:eukaryotic-like serine/threonine-protein kinase